MAHKLLAKKMIVHLIGKHYLCHNMVVVKSEGNFKNSYDIILNWKKENIKNY